MKKHDNIAKRTKQYIYKGVRLLFWGVTARAFLLIPSPVYEFMEQALGAVVVRVTYSLVEFVGTFLILYGLMYLRKVNTYLQISFWSHVLLLFLRIVEAAQGESFTLHAIAYLIVLIASFTLYWGIAQIFASTAPKLSKRFKLLFDVVNIRLHEHLKRQEQGDQRTSAFLMQASRRQWRSKLCGYSNSP